MEEKLSNGREKNRAKGQLDSIPFIDFLLNKLKKCAQEESSTEKQQKEEKNDSEQQKN